MTERNITKKRRVKKKKEEEEKKEKEEDEKDDDDLEDSADQKSVASDTPGKTASLSSVNWRQIRGNEDPVNTGIGEMWSQMECRVQHTWIALHTHCEEEQQIELFRKQTASVKRLLV